MDTYITEIEHFLFQTDVLTLKCHSIVTDLHRWCTFTFQRRKCHTQHSTSKSVSVITVSLLTVLYFLKLFAKVCLIFKGRVSLVLILLLCGSLLVDWNVGGDKR